MRAALVCAGATLLAASMAVAMPPLELASSIAMPGLKGRIDHIAADPAGRRLFVAALGNGSLEVLDLRGGERRTLPGLREPQGVLYLRDSKRLVIARGGDGRVDLVDAATLRPLRSIDGLDDADNLRYDTNTHRVVAGYGDGGLRVIDPDTGGSVRNIELPGHPESFRLEREGNRIFVNVPAARSVVVVDRETGAALARWATADASSNFPMALDEAHRRLFVGTRVPAALLVYDIDSGRIVARMAIGRDVDDLFWDENRMRLYAICGEGRIDVVRREAPDRYALETSITTARGARTGLFVPEDSALYVAAPASRDSPARILVYRTH